MSYKSLRVIAWILFTSCAVLVICILLLAKDAKCEPLPIVDQGTLYRYGAVSYVRRGHALFASWSGETPWGQSATRAILALKPEQSITSLAIGPFKYRELSAMCGELVPPRFRIEITIGTSSAHLDSVRDKNSPAIFRSDVLMIPFIGVGDSTYTDRMFYSSVDRSQGSDIDNFVPFINQSLLHGDPFVIRIVPEAGSGIIVSDAYDFGLTVTYDSPSAADKGDPICVRWIQRPDAFHGLMLSGRFNRQLGTDAFISLSAFYRADLDNPVFSRGISIPVPDSVLSGVFNVELCEDAPYIYGYKYPMNIWGVLDSTLPVTCRADSLILHWKR